MKTVESLSDEELLAELEKWNRWMKDAADKAFEGELGADAVHVSVRLQQLEDEREKRQGVGE